MSAAPAEVFVLFVPAHAAPTPRWWHRLLDPARVHVVALWQAGRVALSLDHQGRHLVIEAIDTLPAEDAARGLMWAWHAEALRVAPRAVPRGGALRPAMTCVEAVKAVLGVLDWRILTPRQLRRALIRMGARPLSPFPDRRF